MKKIIIVLTLLGLLVLGVSAQTIDFSTYQGAFQDFADAVAGSLPFNASIGLDWAPSYLGQLPHFGVGLVAGASGIPYEAVAPVLDALSITLPSEMDFTKEYGVPFPAAALNARLGGIGLPFDVGVKAGFIPDKVKAMLPFGVDFLMLGGDLRVPLVKDRGLIPGISVGGGYTYLRGGVTMPDAMAGQSVDISQVMDPMAAPDTYVLSFTDPDVNFNWQAHVIEAKAQISKNLFIITPYAGIGAAYGISKAGGGLQSSVDYTRPGYTGAIQQQHIDEIKAAFASAGYEAPEISAGGFLLNSAVQGWSVRAYGGLSLNLLLVRLDLTGGYNLLNQAYSLSANARIQL